MSVDEAGEALAQSVREAIAELERGLHAADSPEGRLLEAFREALAEWEAADAPPASTA